MGLRKGGEGREGEEGRQVMLGPRLGTGRTQTRVLRILLTATHAGTHTNARRTRRTRIEHTAEEGILTHGIPVVGPRDGSAGNVAGVKSASQESVPRGDQISLRTIDPTIFYRYTFLRYLDFDIDKF